MTKIKNIAQTVRDDLLKLSYPITGILPERVRKDLEERTKGAYNASFSGQLGMLSHFLLGVSLIYLCEDSSLNDLLGCSLFVDGFFALMRTSLSKKIKTETYCTNSGKYVEKEEFSHVAGTLLGTCVYGAEQLITSPFKYISSVLDRASR